MLLVHDREMLGKNRIWIAQQFVSVAAGNALLLAWAVLIAQKTFAIADGMLVGFRGDGGATLGIELRFDDEAAEIEIARLHGSQRREIAGEQIPGAFLPLQKLVGCDGQVIHGVRIACNERNGM